MKQKKPIKVLQIVGAMNRAGTETMVMNLYRKLKPNHIQFDFISYSSEEAHYDQEIIKLGGDVFKLTKTTSVFALFQLIKKHGPYDAVHVHTLFHSGVAILAAFFANVKVRITHAHTTFDHRETLLRQAYMIIMRSIILIFSTHLLACSKAAGEFLYGNNCTKRSNYLYFPNMIDYTKFMTHTKVDISNFKRTEQLDHHFIVGHIGRFSHEKNQAFLIDVMKYLLIKNPSIKLLLVGDGELRSYVEKKATDLGIKESVRFTGVREDVNLLLPSMDVFVFPSIYEGLGLVLLEAQACGIPCVVSQAIQPEADINLGLVSKLSLSNNAEVWANQIIAMKEKKIKNKNEIRSAFKRSGYSTHEGLKRVLKIYQSHSGEEYERYIDRLV